MPFTPFHLGPGTAIKAVAGRHFSLTVFGLAQVLIDLEPLVRIVRHDAMLHGFSHTYLSALVLAAVAAMVGKPLFGGLLRVWNGTTRRARASWAQVRAEIPWRAAWGNALIGTLSHIWLDSFIYRDMHPWLPFSQANGLLGLVPGGWVYGFYVLTGVVGLVILLMSFLYFRGSGIDGLHPLLLIGDSHFLEIYSFIAGH